MQDPAGHGSGPGEMDHPVLGAQQRQEDQDRNQQRRIFAEIAVAADPLHQLPVIAIANADFLRAPDRDNPDGQREAEQDQQGDIGGGDADLAALADLHQGFHGVTALPWFRVDCIKQT